MAKSKDCVDIVLEKLRNYATDEEITSAFETVKKQRRNEQRALGKEKNALDEQQKLLETINAGLVNEEVLLKAKKRALTLQAETLAKNVDFVLNTFKGNEYEGLSSLLVGTNYATSGSRLSIDAKQVALSGEYIGGLLVDLQKLSDAHVQIFSRGTNDKDIANAMWSLDNPHAEPYQGNKEALEIAQVIHKWQEKARSDANLSGAWIGKEPGYVVRQTHDPMKMQKQGFLAWAKMIKPLLDWKRMGVFSDEDAFLREVYDNLLTGVRIKKLSDAADDNAPRLQAGNPGILGSTAAKMSAERVLHFKDDVRLEGKDKQLGAGEAWLAYNEIFGRGSLREAVITGLQQNAQNTVLMRSLGVSPQVNFENLRTAVLQDLRLQEQKLVTESINNVDAGVGVDADTQAQIDAINKQIKKIQKSEALTNQLKEVDGSLNFDASPTLASIGRNIRMMNNMTKLGGAAISAISDLGFFSAEMAYQGQSFLGSMGKAINGLLSGRGSKEQREILASLGVFFDHMSGEVVARAGGGDDTGGTLTRMQTLFFRLNGLSWWSDSMQKSAGLMLAHELGAVRGSSFAELSTEKRRVLDLFNIGDAEWEIYRSMNMKAADGKDYLTPDGIDDLSKSAIVRYLKAKGLKVNDLAIDNARFELKEKLRSYYRDRIGFAVLAPDAKTRAISRQGTSAGTWKGEAARFVMQFKSFMVASLQKVYGREYYGRGSKNWKQRVLNTNGELMALAQTMLFTTLLGYVSMTIKDLLKGRTPRAVDDPRTWTAALLQGGGAGIFGDFIFGTSSRFGGGLIPTLAGPTASTADELARIWVRIREGDNLQQQLLRFTTSHMLPGQSLYFVKPVLDYALMYNLYEQINPGYFRRMERRVKKENNQTFYMRPWF